MERPMKIFAAELIGTAILMIGGPGSAILGKGIGTLGIALAFGFSLLIAAYAIGPISGCHINPAVTVGLWLARKVDKALVPFYIVAQLVGAFIGGLVIWIIAHGTKGFDATDNFAANGWANHSPGHYNFGAMLMVEIFFTALLVFVVLSTTSRKFSPVAGGLTVGLTLALIHLVTIPVDNTSVNPARSFGAAVFAGKHAITQLWAFVVFPLIGAAIGLLCWLAVDDARLADTMMANRAMTKARDIATAAVDKVVDTVEDVADKL
jgi:aquaporin Z